MVFQGAAVLAAAMAWLTVWCLGLIAASDRCPEGPLSRRGHRRPLVAATVGLCCPGLGLLLSGRRVRCIVTLAVVGAGAVATLLLLRAPFSWQAHHADPDPMFSDLQVERIFLVLAGTLAAGALAWLVSALEGGRLAAGPRVVRAVSGADRVPAALLISLVALGIWFRPLDAAHGLDRLTHQLTDGGLRLAPLWTARAAAFLAPAEPVLELRVAERQEALGRHEEATATRQELYRRWRSLALSEGARPAAEDAGNDAGDPGRAGWSRAGLAPTSPLPLAKASSPAPPPPAR
jgi:hypothetical protein